MKFFTSVIIFSSLFASYACADGFRFEVGPFRMNFHSSDRHYHRSPEGEYYRASDGRYYREHDRRFFHSNDPRYLAADEYRYSPSITDYATIRTLVDAPICQAIASQKKLEIYVEGIEQAGDKEKKILYKKLVVEPYAFGVTNDGEPVLHGTIVSENQVKETPIENGNDRFKEPNNSSQKNGKGFFADVIVSDKNTNIDIRRVVQIQVIENSHFNIPKSYKGMDDPDVRVLCQLPVSR